MAKIISLIRITLLVLTNLINICLEFVTKVIEPIADKTETNKDDEFCVKAVDFLKNKAKPLIGKVQTWINKLL